MKLKIIIFILILLATACKNSQPADEQNDLLKVKTRVAEESIYQHIIHTSGKIYPREELRLSFMTGGIIRQLPIQEGEKVLEGQLLAKLDLQEINAKVEQAELALEKARRDLDRVTELYEDTVATLEQKQNASTAYELAKKDVEIARHNLKYSTIEAPGDGIILKIIARENELIAPGHPVILFGQTEGSWKAKVNITDKDITNLSEGDSAGIYLDAFPEKRFSAKVSEISGMADPYSGTFKVELNLVEYPNNIMSGMIIKADIYTQKKRTYIKVPLLSVMDITGNRGYIWNLSQGELIKKNVTLAHVLENGVLIQSGLDCGDTVITRGADYLSKNARFEIIHE